MADIVPGGIPSAEAHGSSKSKGVIRSWKPTNWRLEEQGAPRPIIAPVSILSGEQFGSLEFAYKIKNAGAMASAEAFGSTIVHLSTTIYAASPALADVQAAIASADSGDTVVIPSGSATWASTLYIASSKAIHLQGNGGIGDKGIGDGLTKITVTAGIGVDLDSTEGHQFTVSQLEFIFGTSIGEVLNPHGGCKTWRIHHCRFLCNRAGGNSLTHAIWAGSGADGAGVYGYGLIDNCYFLDCRVEGIQDGNGHASWKRALNLGTAEAVYLEDNTFDQWAYADSLDGNYGAKWVFRHNDVLNSSIEFHSTQQMGGGGLYGKGTRSVEIHDNQFYAIGHDGGERPGLWTMVCVRGGTGVVCNNTLTTIPGGYLNQMITIDNVRTFEAGHVEGLANGHSTIDGNTAVASGSGVHTGSDGASVLTCSGKTWTVNAYVGTSESAVDNCHYIINTTDGSRGRITANTATTVTATLSGGTRNHWDAGDAFIITNGYPAADQLGRSTDHGAGTDYHPQLYQPIYIFHNSRDGTSQATLVHNNCGVHIQHNRDYFEGTPANEPSFNGSSGVGYGLLSARPASCSTEYVGYWATDTQTLYRWVSGAWEVYWQPYTYPHPLRSGA